MRKTQSTSKRGFTLIELLVVIAIIALLAALAYPAILGAMDKAKQLKDLSNIGQAGLVFLNYANDHDGNFPSNTSGILLFNSLTNGGYLTEPKIVAGSGYPAMTTAGALVASNIAWGAVQGYTTSDNSSLPLLVSKGTVLTMGTGYFTVNASANYWGLKGKSFAAVYYINGAAANPSGYTGLVATNVLLGSYNSNSFNVLTN